MKKLICSILLLGIAATTTHAQDFYLKAGGGYAFAMPGQTRDQFGNALNGTVSGASLSNTGFDLKSASFSSGVHGIIGGGYMFTKNMGVELNADIAIAPRKYTETETALENSSGQFNDYTATRQSKTTILLMPSFVLQTTNKKRCNLYMRMGIALPLNTGIKMQETYHYYQTGDYNAYTWNIQNYFSVGFTAATGIKVKIGDNLSVWGEASMLYLALSRKERDLETFSSNGTSYPLSVLSGITTYHYIKNGVTNTNGTQQAFSQPYSNIGVNVGISYTLHKPKPHNNDLQR